MKPAFRGDPQPIVKINGLWHFYYLYNVDYPDANGTAWKLLTSRDLIDWHDEGIAIPKYTTPNGDPWSGCVVVDHDNTAGFGKNAAVALCTMPLPGGQGTTRWFSTDDGHSFTFDQVVMTNPNAGNQNITDKVFRDPRIIWMEKERCWVMVLAEIGKIGIYSSKNLKDWAYLSGFMCGHLGTIECPTLFPITARDKHGRFKGERWIMLCSANGYEIGFTTGAHYWIGHFDGHTFAPDEPSGRWLDGGSDFYACAVWGDHPVTSVAQEAYYAVSWKNNWDYARDLVNLGYYGEYTKFRTLSLIYSNKKYILTNNFINSTDFFNTNYITYVFNHTLTSNTSFHLPDIHKNNTAITITFEKEEKSPWPKDITLDFQLGTSSPLSFILSPHRNNVNLKRDGAGATPSKNIAWTAERNAPLQFGNSVTLTALLSEKSVEVVFNDGVLSMTSLVFAKPKIGTSQISLSNGTCLIKNLIITNT
ncbi:hypothetical protein D5366_08830 [Neokomagataea tanensis]|uniref:Uncharacterized protein n=3 Tax=Neokomagataea TaxID=1223423 RepID=A0A4Y6V9Y9_9PROT|nr:glycoside hydrolase family 32 protein [Neokomagataea tanensis]QDH25296.1 hypothetical protein D5366_08830 [Neokomagataea tanensis]